MRKKDKERGNKKTIQLSGRGEDVIEREEEDRQEREEKDGGKDESEGGSKREKAALGNY